MSEVQVEYEWKRDLVLHICPLEHLIQMLWSKIHTYLPVL